MKRVKALGLFSGGLDSILATLLLREQGIEVTGLVWVTPFFNVVQARRSAAQINLPLREEDLTERFLPLLRHPPHGFGKHLNPCVDCHLLMLKEAGRLMEAEGYDFLFTGEVLGQRPFSQHRWALEFIARECGCADRLLRPLSAQLLPVTKPEREGLVDRSRLLALKGRGRKAQLELAARFGLTSFPSPAGGCLLTDKGYSDRLRDLLAHQQQLSHRDLELLKYGRHFRLNPDSKAIVGRHQRDNEAIQALSQPGDLLLKVADYPGPLVLLPQTSNDGALAAAASLCASYSDAPPGALVTVNVQGPEGSRTLAARREPREIFHKLLI